MGKTKIVRFKKRGLEEEKDKLEMERKSARGGIHSSEIHKNNGGQEAYLRERIKRENRR